jgi:glycosyltransferase involved in cell wall biosynthesis
MAQTLQKYCGEVFSTGPIPLAKGMPLGKIVHRSSFFFLKKKYLYQNDISAAKRYAKIAGQRIAGQSFDVIVAPSGGTEIIAFLETNIPIVYIHDGTYNLFHNYYPFYSNLLEKSFRELNTIEELAIKNASLLIYSSAWAARSAVEDYYADPGKVHVVPFGANLDNPPAQVLVQQRKKSECCKLLFVGVDWERKGGAIAFETLLQLEKQGISAELIICGCVPPRQFSHPRIRVIPFLDKNDQRQRKELEQLFIEADFFLLPTRSDCTPIVFCEANAFGLPVITTDTGGVSEIIRDGENGFVLPYEARGAAYAQVIAQVYQDEQRYTHLVQSSRTAFENRLNWDTWGSTVKCLLADLLNRNLGKACEVPHGPTAAASTRRRE